MTTVMVHFIHVPACCEVSSDDYVPACCEVSSDDYVECLFPYQGCMNHVNDGVTLWVIHVMACTGLEHDLMRCFGSDHPGHGGQKYTMQYSKVLQEA